MSQAVSDLLVLFNSLSPPPDSSADSIRFAAHQLMGYPNHHVGKDDSGRPALLIAVKPDVSHARPAPIVLEHLTVQHDVECRLHQPDGTARSGRFSVIRCLGIDRVLHEYFIRAVTPIVLKLPVLPSQADVTQAINSLVELFRLLTMPPRKTIQGLWAELFVITQASDPSKLIQSWHTVPEDRYDFCAGRQRVEVKSATGRFRCHHFSLEQLRPPLGTTVLIASLFVEHATGGDTVFDLVERVRLRVYDDPQLLAHLDQVVGATLGSGWRQATEIRFDRELATDSLRFFEATAIPCITPQPPPEITEVRFKSDLSRTPATDLASRGSEGSLFRAIRQ